MSHLTRNHCRVLDTQMTVKAQGSFVLWRKWVSMCYKVHDNTHTHFSADQTFFNRLMVSLPHPAASRSSWGKSELSEGATWEADRCNQGQCTPPSAYIVDMCICIVMSIWFLLRSISFSYCSNLCFQSFGVLVKC